MLKVFGSMMILVAALVNGAAAQYRDKIVFFSDDPGCGSKNFVAGLTSSPVCSKIVDEDGPVYTISFGGVRVSTQFIVGKNVLSTRTKIENLGSKKIPLERESWSIAHYTAESNFLAGEAPIVNERAFDPVKPRPLLVTAGVFPDSNSSGGSGPGYSPVTSTISAGNVATGPSQIPSARQPVIVKPAPSTPTQPSGGIYGSSTPKSSASGNKPFSLRQLVATSVKEKMQVSGVVTFRRIAESNFQLVFIHVLDKTFVFQIR